MTIASASLTNVATLFLKTTREGRLSFINDSLASGLGKTWCPTQRHHPGVAAADVPATSPDRVCADRPCGIKHHH